MKKQGLKIVFYTMVLLLSACGSKRVTLSEADYGNEAASTEVAANESAPASEPAAEPAAPTAEETKEALEALVANGEVAEEEGDQVAMLSQEVEAEATSNSEATSDSIDMAAAAELAAPQLVAQAEMPKVSSQPVEKPKARRHTKRTPSESTPVTPTTESVEAAPKVEEPTAKVDEAPKADAVVASNTTATEPKKEDEVDHFAPAPAANPVEQAEVQTASVGIEGVLQKHPFAIALILVGAIGFVFIIARMRRGTEV